jgi:hypothetical protein
MAGAGVERHPWGALLIANRTAAAAASMFARGKQFPLRSFKRRETATA